MRFVPLLLFVGVVVWLSVRQAKLNRFMRDMGSGPDGSGLYVSAKYSGPPD